VLIRTTSTSTSTVYSPVVTITSPKSGAIYSSGSGILLTATATVSGSSISKVEFYANSKLITTEKAAPYSWTWTNVAAGTYSITAKAYAANGKITTSSAVSITMRSASAAIVDPFDEQPNESFADLTSVKLYPNPAITFIQLEFNQVQDDPRVYFLITDAMGKTISRIQKPVFGRQVRLDISNLQTGIYFVTLQGKKGKIVRRFLKQ
jgi:hypothetical protein